VKRGQRRIDRIVNFEDAINFGDVEHDPRPGLEAGQLDRPVLGVRLLKHIDQRAEPAAVDMVHLRQVEKQIAVFGQPAGDRLFELLRTGGDQTPLHCNLQHIADLIEFQFHSRGFSL